jgi:hypothetical protein
MDLASVLIFSESPVSAAFGRPNSKFQSFGCLCQGVILLICSAFQVASVTGLKDSSFSSLNYTFTIIV